MKKFYNEIKIEIKVFIDLEDVLTASSGVITESELDGDTTTIPEDWL